MHKEGSYKKQQTTLEIIIILAVVGIVAISIALLYVKNVHNNRLAGTDEVVSVAYFSGANGQPICNATEGENTCFEILLTQPLPRYPTYNLTYWNEKDPSGNYTFKAKQDNYVICFTSPLSNQFDGYSTICDWLDNYDDVNYIGQVNGYYEYTINEGGFPIGQTAFLSYLTLYYYSPNLLGNLTNTSYILPLGEGFLPVEMHLNSTSLVNLLPEEPVQVTNFDNVLSVTEVGLTTGDSLLYSETFANGTTNSGSFPITSNSENTFVISNLTNQLPETVTLSLTGISNGITVGKETLTTSDNNNVFINFTPPAPIKLISTTSTVGPFVVTTNRNEEFSNMVITTGNTLSNGGITDNAYITNITSNHVEFFIKTPANIIYLNFEGVSQLSQNGPTGEAPYLNPNVNYGQYDDGTFVFDNYTNFASGNPSSGQFGTTNAFDQNAIEANVLIAGPFTFNANGNKLMNFLVDNGLNITPANSIGNLGNLYLPIKSGETYILGAIYNPGGARNIGISNSTDGYYIGSPAWTNGLFEREACLNIYLFYIYPGSPYLSSCGTQSTSFYYNAPQITTYSLYNLNGNAVSITFPDDNENKTFSEPVNGTIHYFTIESTNVPGFYYYLAETSQPVQMEICQPPYSAPNTITCTT